jgi:hypothetical protein
MDFEYQETFGARIRQFFKELLGSRLVERLETDLITLRNDFDQRMHEQVLIIAGLREEKQILMSKIMMYENTVMAHSSRMGAEVVAYQKPKPPKPSFSFVDAAPTMSRWEKVQADHDEQMRKEIEEEKQPKTAVAAS